jgi:hypothetical protein
MGRRILAVLSVELEEEELDARLPGSPNLPRARSQQRWPSDPETAAAVGSWSDAASTGKKKSPAAGLLASASGPERPHVRIWMPGVTTMLVPHARVQEHERAASATLLADVILHVYALSTRDWAAAHSSYPGVCTLARSGSGAGSSSSSSGLIVHSPIRSDANCRPRSSARRAASPRTCVARPPLASDSFDLAGLQRLVIGGQELARCGLAVPRRMPSSATLDLPLPSISSSLAQAMNDVDDREALPTSATLYSPDGGDANLFVLSVQRMQRKRHERAKMRGALGGSAVGGPLSPVKSAAANCLAASVEHLADPLTVVPFDIWSVEAVGAPPGAPKGGLLEKAASKSKNVRGRPRGKGRA